MDNNFDKIKTPQKSQTQKEGEEKREAWNSENLQEKRFVHAEARMMEEDLAKMLNAEVSGGFNDGGRDIVNIPGLPEIKGVQLKSSWHNAQKFLAKSLELKEFIPIIVGDPGMANKDEIIASIKKYGGWVSPDIGNRTKKMENIAKLRDVLTNS